MKTRCKIDGPRCDWNNKNNEFFKCTRCGKTACINCCYTNKRDEDICGDCYGWD